MEKITEEEAKAREAFKHDRLPRKPGACKFANVTWNKDAARWMPIIAIKGRTFSLGRFKPFEQEEAARVADQARWWLQDFLPRAPRYNFPEEIPPIDECPAKVYEIRCLLRARGLRQNAPHHPDFVAPEEIECRRSAAQPLKPVAQPSAPETEINCCDKGVNGIPCEDCERAMRPDQPAASNPAEINCCEKGVNGIPCPACEAAMKSSE